MTSEGLVFLVLLIGSLALIVDYGGAGKFLLDTARQQNTAGKPRPFIRGLGWELLTTIAFNTFWMMALVVNAVVVIPGPIIAIAHTALVIAAIAGRRVWWKQITPAVKDSHIVSEEEANPNGT